MIFCGNKKEVGEDLYSSASFFHRKFTKKLYIFCVRAGFSIFLANEKYMVFFAENVEIFAEIG